MTKIVSFFIVLLLGIILVMKRTSSYEKPSRFQNNDEVSKPTYNHDEYPDESENSNFKYNSRTKNSTGYEYNYDVSGSDENGDGVSGFVDMDGKYGSGYIENESGDEVEVEAEWVDYGQIDAYDDDGNYYELEVD